MCLYGDECLHEPKINEELHCGSASCDSDLWRNDCYCFGPYFDIFGGKIEMTRKEVI